MQLYLFLLFWRKLLKLSPEQFSVNLLLVPLKLLLFLSIALSFPFYCCLFSSRLFFLSLSVSVTDPVCLSRIRIFSNPDPGSASKNLSILTQKIWSGLFIPDQDPGYLPIPDPDVIKAPYPGSGSGFATLLSVAQFLLLYNCCSWPQAKQKTARPSSPRRVRSQRWN